MKLSQLEKLLKKRILEKNTSSYTFSLVESGIEKIVRKVAEESIEVGIEGIKGRRVRLTEEITDLVYHLTVLLLVNKLSWRDIEKELKKRNKDNK